jgi:hypothetical protein
MVPANCFYTDCGNVDDYIEITIDEDSRDKIKCRIGRK